MPNPASLTCQESASEVEYTQENQQVHALQVFIFLIFAVCLGVYTVEKHKNDMGRWWTKTKKRLFK